MIISMQVLHYNYVHERFMKMIVYGMLFCYAEVKLPMGIKMAWLVQKIKQVSRNIVHL